MGNKNNNQKSNDRVEAENFEMELPGKSAFELLKESHPDVSDEKAKELLEVMPLNDARFILDEEKVIGSDQIEGDEPLPEKEIERPIEEAKKTTGDKMQETNNAPTENMDDAFEALMRQQDVLQKKLEKEAGGVTTVDDTADRIERSGDVARTGKRKGKDFKPAKGVAQFMVSQNAKYKAAGKQAPYSNECVKNTFLRENGQLQGKA